MVTRLTIEQSLKHMKQQGFPMSQSTFSRMKRTLKKNELKRLHHIAAIGLEPQHLKRLETLENLERLMWENYHKEKAHYRKVWILNQIKELQPYISTYYETTKAVMMTKPDGTRQDNTSISEDIVPAVE